MKKPRHRFNVYLVGKGCGCYADDYCRTFLGSTLAVSAAQACNNVRNRTKDDKHPNGGLSTWVIDDYAGEGTVFFEYVAELAE